LGACHTVPKGGEAIDLIGKTAFYAQQTSEAQSAAVTELRRVLNSLPKGHSHLESATALETISKDLKGLRGQVDNIEAGPLTHLGWLAKIAQNTEHQA
jgi:hypothetical protein